MLNFMIDDVCMPLNDILSHNNSKDDNSKDSEQKCSHIYGANPKVLFYG